MTKRFAVILVALLIASYGVGAAAEQPSFSLSGKVVNALIGACRVVCATSSPTLPMELRDYSFEIYPSGDSDVVSMFPMYRREIKSVILSPAGVQLTATPPQPEVAPIVIPGYIVGELMAIVRFGASSDDLTGYPWFKSGDYDANVSLAAGALVVAFFAKSSIPAPTPSWTCLSGCSHAIAYWLKLGNGGYTISRMVTL